MQLDAALARSEEKFDTLAALRCAAARRGAAGSLLPPAEKLSANGFKTVIGSTCSAPSIRHARRSNNSGPPAPRGSVTFILEGMAYMPHAFQAHVGAAKAGIDMLMKNLAIEWGPYGIRGNSIVPGPIEGTRARSG